MLIQNADRTTYGVSKIGVAVLAFIIFFVVGFVFWQWHGVSPEPWRLRVLVLTPLTMSLLLYCCCDQLGVYDRCSTLSDAVWRFVRAYLWFVVLSCVVWRFFVPFYWDVLIQTSTYLLTFGSVLWLQIARFRAEQKLVREEATLVVGLPEYFEEFQARLRQDHVDFKDSLVLLHPEEVNSVETRNLMIGRSIGKVVCLTEGVNASVSNVLVRLCGKMGVDFYAPMGVRMHGRHKTYFGVMGGMKMLVYKSTPIPYTTSWQLKQIMDKGGAMLLLVLTSPLWLFAVLGIKLSDPGPIFYRQKRSGLYGREFGMWKFRTMFRDADKKLEEVKTQFGNDMSGPIFKLARDPRIFSFGHILRKFSIDELPQLINVMKGEMSLVGPRPLPVYETDAFTSDEHRRRLSILPGVTGFWQIAGRSDITEFEKLVELDMYYIDHWSLWLDIKLLLQTVPAVLFARGAR